MPIGTSADATGAVADQSSQSDPGVATPAPEFDFDVAFANLGASTAAPAEPAPAASAAPSGGSAPVSDGSTLKPDGEGSGATDDQPAGDEPPADDQPPGTQPGRRARAQARDDQAAIESERQTWAEREQELRSQWEAERQQRQAAEQDLAQRQARDQELVSKIAARCGPEAEFQRLNGLPSTQLTNEESDQLDAWKVARAEITPFIEYAQQMGHQRFMDDLQAAGRELTELPGVTQEGLQRVEGGLGGMMRHFYETAAQLKDQEYRDRIASLEAQLVDARAGAMSQARQAANGGRSAPAQPTPANLNVFDPNLPPELLLERAFG